MTPELGLIEGFFGKPWSWEARHDTIAFLAPHGFSFYIYAPKADPWLRRRWREPHPPEEMERLCRLRDHCRRHKVRFGIGLTPFELHLSERDWRAPLAARLDTLAVIGFDDLAILFDDMRGDVPGLAERQADIVHFAAERSAARRVLCCPSYYSDDPILDVAFGRRPDHYLEDLGRRLDAGIEIMWTGEEVCAREFTPGHLDRIAGQIGRKPFLWDNYPVNDGSRMSQHLHLRAFTGRPAAIAGHVAGHAVNPASQPLLSRIPALTLAESYAAGEVYEYGAAFAHAALTVLGPELAERVTKDVLTLQDRGRDRLGERLPVLRARYAAFDHPAAREIVAWLDGHWNVTDEEVQTQ
ncbi:MAG: beta-N-acetylglucosaminidase domain-containing protein [Allosphingosinicella sp.]|uniref:beta-N-acetylglucosaminidase domain-containing protein n=1 Tax=Allosphingosinicella sp. TaxID=2823234 RepID=UPI0039254CB8